MYCRPAAARHVRYGQDLYSYTDKVTRVRKKFDIKATRSARIHHKRLITSRTDAAAACVWLYMRVCQRK